MSSVRLRTAGTTKGTKTTKVMKQYVGADTVALISKLIVKLFFRFSDFSPKQSESVEHLKSLLLEQLGVLPARVASLFPNIGLAPPTTKCMKALPAEARAVRVLIGHPRVKLDDDGVKIHSMDVVASMHFALLDSTTVAFLALRRHASGSMISAQVKPNAKNQEALAAATNMATCGEVSSMACESASQALVSAGCELAERLARMLAINEAA